MPEPLANRHRHPGEFVRSHLPEGMSVTEAADLIGIGRPALSKFLNGRAALSPQLALAIREALDLDAWELMERQARHDLARAIDAARKETTDA